MATVRYAIVLGGVVDNVVLWDGVQYDEDAVEPGAPAGWTPPDPPALVIKLKSNQRVSPGWAYEGGKFVEPPPPEES